MTLPRRETFGEALNAVLGPNAKLADLARNLEVDEIQLEYWLRGAFTPRRRVILDMMPVWHLKQSEIDRLLNAAGYKLEGVPTVPRNEPVLLEAVEMLTSDKVSDEQKQVLRQAIREAISRAKYSSQVVSTLVPYRHPFDPL